MRTATVPIGRAIPEPAGSIGLGGLFMTTAGWRAAIGRGPHIRAHMARTGGQDHLHVAPAQLVIGL